MKVGEVVSSSWAYNERVTLNHMGKPARAYAKEELTLSHSTTDTQSKTTSDAGSFPRRNECGAESNAVSTVSKDPPV